MFVRLCRSVVAVALLVLVVVLGLIVVALVRRESLPDTIVGGNEDAPVPGHELALAHAKELIADVAAKAKAVVVGGTVDEADVSTVGGSGKRHWTEFKSWAELGKNPAAHKEYQADRRKLMGDFALDWKGVRNALRKELRDNREWAGLINIVDGKPKIVHKEPSPFLLRRGQGEISGAVPASLVKKLAATPAMFMFHTHPETTHPLISPHDAVIALLHTYQGQHAAHVVVSRDAVTMYGCRSDLAKEIHSTPNPHLTALVRAFDIFTAMTGLRSWPPGHTVRDVRALMDRHWFLYVLYPEPSFARLEHNRRFRPWTHTDFDMLASLEVHLKEAKEAALAEKRKKHV